MRKIILSAVLLTGLAAQAFAEVNVSADVVSRYLFRGEEVPGGMAIQPQISYSTGSVTIGTWVSQPMMDGMTETNLYVSFDAGPLGITITDYTDLGTSGKDELGNKLPGKAEFFSFGDHLMELMVTYEAGDLSAAVALDFLNGNIETDASVWAQIDYAMGQMGDADVSLSLGIGTEKYTEGEDGDPYPALIGINASQGDYFASYQINPAAKGNMAMIGKSF